MRQRTETKRGKLPAPATINRDLAYLKMIFNEAIKHKWVRDNPVDLVTMFEEDNEDDVFFTPEQFRAITERQTPVQAMITEIAVQTGMRLEEQFRLEISDLNLPLGLIRLPDTKSGGKQWVELNLRAIELFESILELHDDPRWVFPSTAPRHKGKPMNGRYFSDHYFIPHLEALGLPGRWHTLRHTFGSWLRMAGVDLATIRDLMRHSTQAVTERYAHIGRYDRKAAVNKLGSVYEAATPTATREERPALRLVK